MLTRRYFIGAAAGSIAAGTAFGLVHYALFHNDPARQAEGFTLDILLQIATMMFGAIVGAFLGGPDGSVRLNRGVADALRGALWGVAATAVLGLASSSFYRPKQVEEHKARWVLFGLPSGALLGALIGAILARRLALKSAASARVDRISLDGRPLP